jgi:hypothetical protein
MKKIYAIVFILLLISQANAQQPFQSAVGGPDADAGRSIIKTADGGYAIVGNTFSYDIDSSDVYVIKLNSSGVIEWTKTIGGPSFDAGAGIAQTSDGGFAITGRTGYWFFEMYIIKLDGSGNLQWTKKVNKGLFDQGYGIIQTTDGGYAVSGRSDGQINNYNGTLVKLNSAGTVEWMNGIDDFMDGAYSVVQTSDHGYVLAGATMTFISAGIDLFVVKLDSNGNLAWTSIIGGPGTEMVFPGSKIIKSADGGFAFAGYTDSYGAGSNDVYIIKLSATGALQWTRVVGGTGDDMGYNITQTTDKGYAIAGSTTSFGAGNKDAYIIKLDSNGVLLWTRATGGPGEETANDIVQTSDGGFLIAGTTTSYGSGGSDVYLVKLDAQGNSCNNTGSGGLSTTGGVGGSGGGFASALISTSGSGGFAGSGGNYSSICGCTISAGISHTGPLNFCSGGSVLLKAPAGTGLTYQWKKSGVIIPGATASTYTATASGTYKVTVTNVLTGCSKTSGTGAVVTVYSNPAASITPQGPTSFCAGDSVQLKANYNSTYLYQWKKNNTNITGATINKYYAKTAGSYKVKVTNANGCTAISNTVTVTVPCRNGDMPVEAVSENDFGVEVFPNPSRESFILKIDGIAETEYSVRIYDITGREVHAEVIKSSSREFKISGMNPGVYFAAVSGRQSQRMVRISKIE